MAIRDLEGLSEEAAVALIMNAYHSYGLTEEFVSNIISQAIETAVQIALGENDG